MSPDALLRSSPDAAVSTLFAGIALIYLECNRPGSIVPGCFGALFTLLALNAFSQMTLRPSALALIGVGVALIPAELVLPARNLIAAAGAAMLALGLRLLVQPFAAAHVHTPTALAAGAGFTFVTLCLARIALRARRNKRSLSLPRAAPQRRTG